MKKWKAFFLIPIMLFSSCKNNDSNLEYIKQQNICVFCDGYDKDKKIYNNINSYLNDIKTNNYDFYSISFVENLKTYEKLDKSFYDDLYECTKGKNIIVTFYGFKDFSFLADTFLLNGYSTSANSTEIKCFEYQSFTNRYVPANMLVKETDDYYSCLFFEISRYVKDCLSRN